MKKSLRARLTFYVVLPVMLSLLLSGGLGFYSTTKEAEELYDAELSHVATLMLSLLRAEDQEEAKHNKISDDDETTNPDIVELGGDFDRTEQRHDRKLAFRIWKDGRLLFYSSKAADFGDERVTAGFSNQELHEKEWRFYVLPDSQSGYTIEVAQRSKIRTLLINKLLTTIFSPLFFLLPIVLFVTWLGLRTGLKPLLVLSDAVKRRSALDLTPLPISQSWVETKPLVDSINGLLANLDYALTKERRFTDIAAHELRTPIAIFKTQAQTALKSTNESERRTILEAQVQAANRATNMVDKLLTLARLEHTDIPTETLSLNEIAQFLVQERRPLAEQKNITLRFEPQEPVLLHGNKELLALILSNLIDNAIKYTPQHGSVTVSLSKQQLSVSDTGSGIPDDKLPHVTERFYRLSHHLQPGAGLGLTIVKRAADLMGAKLVLQNKTTGCGLEVLLQFPHSDLSS